jgi:hypothetical protein
MRNGRSALAIRAPVGAVADDALYENLYPYYAELCALSEIRKKPGLGVELRSGMGGHSLLYLSGVCLDRRAGYPTLKLCDPGVPRARRGVGISVNSHYKNANWVAAEGRDFVFRGGLEPGERLSGATYARTQDRAKAMGILDGVKFHDHLFRNKPRGMSRRDYMYEISVATDYAVRFGRDTYRARVPLDRGRMSAIIDFLNGLNAPYRDGAKIFRWSVFNNNCSHVAHNALSVAEIWAPWPTGQFFAIAAFKFPVPKNEFVDLVLRTNDLPIQDVQALYRDPVTRRSLLEVDTLPTAPGALAIAEEAIQDNDIYDIDRLRLIFYDNPFWGPYRPRFARIFREPRYFDLRANLRHFAALYDSALDHRRTPRTLSVRPEAGGGSSGEQARFCAHYDRYIEREAARVRGLLVRLTHPAGIRAAAIS